MTYIVKSYLKINFFVDSFKKIDNSLSAIIYYLRNKKKVKTYFVLYFRQGKNTVILIR